jgi:LmbE family N-acetylglucosaminyl deacetylase
MSRRIEVEDTIKVSAPIDLVRMANQPVLIVVAHADDAVLFCGGTVALLARSGARITIVRATNDDTDSADLSSEETIALNSREFAYSCEVLGVADVIDLGYPSDRMSEIPELELRERLIRIVRQVKPYAVLTFDPHSVGGEDNQDHLCTARAMDEAFWTAMFDKHHPEHADLGLFPHGVVERWYFGRPVSDVTDVVDISSVLDIKAEAAACHATMLGNLVRQLHLMGRTDGRTLPDVRDIDADLPQLIRDMVQAGSRAAGLRHGLGAAEEFRRVRFSGMEPLVDLLEKHYAQKGDH